MRDCRSHAARVADAAGSCFDLLLACSALLSSWLQEIPWPKITPGQSTGSTFARLSYFHLLCISGFEASPRILLHVTPSFRMRPLWLRACRSRMQRPKAIGCGGSSRRKIQQWTRSSMSWRTRRARRRGTVSSGRASLPSSRKRWTASRRSVTRRCQTPVASGLRCAARCILRREALALWTHGAPSCGRMGEQCRH